MFSCKVAATPMNVNEKLQLEDVTEKANARNFRSLVGGLTYEAHIRLDICFAVGVVLSFMNSPTKHHYGAAIRILLILQEIRLCLFGTLRFQIPSYLALLVVIRQILWIQKDHFSCSVVNLGSAAVTWSSKKQAIIAYFGATSSSCQAARPRRLISDLC